MATMVRRALTLALPVLLAACASRRALDADPLASERALYASGRFADVAADLAPERLARLPRSIQPDAYALLADSQQRAGRLGDALATYQYAEELFPKDLEVVSGLAWLLHGQQLDDKARPLFERVVRIHPRNASGNLGLAEILRAQGDLADAQACYEIALGEQGWGDNASIWREYAELLADRQRYDDAERAIERSLTLGSAPDTLLVAARIARRRGDAAEGYRRLAQALAAAPARDETRLMRALWLLDDGRYGDALADADATLSRGQDPLALWVRARVRAHRGDLAGARADLAAAAAQEMEHPFVARAAKALLGEISGSSD